MGRLQRHRKRIISLSSALLLSGRPDRTREHVKWRESSEKCIWSVRLLSSRSSLECFLCLHLTICSFLSFFPIPYETLRYYCLRRNKFFLNHWLYSECINKFIYVQYLCRCLHSGIPSQSYRLGHYCTHFVVQSHYGPQAPHWLCRKMEGIFVK